MEVDEIEDLTLRGGLLQVQGLEKGTIFSLKSFRNAPHPKKVEEKFKQKKHAFLSFFLSFLLKLLLLLYDVMVDPTVE